MDIYCASCKESILYGSFSNFLFLRASKLLLIYILFTKVPPMPEDPEVFLASSYFICTHLIHLWKAANQFKSLNKQLENKPD